ncbi:MAG: cyclic pyranopterin monophosphate synthase MoaC [Thermodesulfobacteriota bacterium]
MEDFSHLDRNGSVRMVDVTEKQSSFRHAAARSVIRMKPETFHRIIHQQIDKGNVLETARIAGIMAAKKTAELIPMCHPLNLTHVRIDFHPDDKRTAIAIRVDVRLNGPTGVEMEALTAATVAALTIYDMCKAIDREMRISDIVLLEKAGGKSGHFLRPEDPDLLD